jgi:Peptidase family M23
MRRFPLLLLLAALPALPSSLAALEVRFHPADVVYTYEADAAHQLSTLMLQNVAVVQKDGPPVTVESLSVELRAGGQTFQTVVVTPAELEAAAARLAALDAQGLLKLYDFAFQTSRSLGPGIRPAADRNVAPGTGLLVSGKAFLFAGTPDELVVTARCRDAAGQPVEAAGRLKVAAYQSANTYRFPLAGVTYVGAAPSLNSHHRWAPNQEFALDLLALGGEGTTHKGSGARLDDYYAYGRDVLAVADGVVVEAAADGVEAHDRLRQPGEGTADFEKRTIQAQNALLAKSVKAPLGNYVIVRHAGGEHSHYAHLKQGSVRVKAGDAVQSGQVLGQLGHTGNSTEPHLHFQITDGPDPMYSRGLPVAFQGVEEVALGLPPGTPLQSGWIVRSK